MLAFTTIITSIFLVLMFLSFAYEWETMSAISVTALLIIGLVFWFFLGFGRADTAHGKIVSKEKYEILIGEDKIIITNLYNRKITETFEDAARYNIISHNRDKYYLEITEYDMYGNKNSTKIDVKDSRFVGK